MSRHTIVAIFLVACCCYGTALLAQQREAESAAATHARSHGNDAKVQADARARRLPEQAPTQADVPVTEA